MNAIVDDAGRRTDIVRDGSGRITEVTDPMNVSYAYGYSGGRLAWVRDGEDDTVRYEYQNGRLASIQKPDGSERLYHYANRDGRWVVVATTDEEGNVETFEYDFAGRSTTYTNPSGASETHEYNGDYLTTRIVYDDGTYRTRAYDEQQNLILETNEAGESWQYEYDGRKNRTAAVDPEGNRHEWTYNGANQVTRYEDPLHRVTAYSYDSRGNLTRVDYPGATSESWTYDSRGRATSWTDERGNVTRYTYDSFGNLASVEDPEGGVREYVVDPLGNVRSVTDEEDYVTRYEYNDDYRVERVDHPGDGEEILEYDNRKDLVRRVDPVVYRYDDRHLLLEVENALGEIVAYDYRPDGLMAERRVGRRIAADAAGSSGGAGVSSGPMALSQAAVTGTDDPAAALQQRLDRYEAQYGAALTQELDEDAPEIVWERTTRWSYDERGRVVEELQVETGITQSWTYDDAGRVVSETDGRGKTTHFGYDDAGRIEWVRDPLGHTEWYDYTAVGRLASHEDRTGAVTYFEYDLRDRLERRIDPLSNVRRYEYDAMGNRTAYIDENNERTEYTFDDANRLVRIEDPRGATTDYEYDARGLRTAEIDPRGNRYEWVHDGIGTIIEEIDPVGGRTQIERDPMGRITEITDRVGATRGYRYDAVGRRTMEIDPYGNVTRYSYSAAGDLTTIENAAGGMQRRVYDAAGRVTAVIDETGGRTSYGWDGAGNLVSVTDPEGRGTRYEYDDAGRLVAEINGVGDRTEYEYDEEGRRTAMIDARGERYEYAYDDAGRLVRETNRLGATQRYRYDDVGNRIEMEDFNGSTTEYEYDEVGRLASIAYEDGVVHSYEYDAAGNMTFAANDIRQYEYTYDELNRLVQSSDVDLGRTVEYEYDAEGRRTLVAWQDIDRETRYTYGAAGELQTVTDPEGNTTRYTYDTLLRETTRVAANGITTERSYDPAGRVRMIRERTDRGEIVSGEAYVYDASGRRTHTIDEERRLTRYRYDDAGRLVETLYPMDIGKIAQDFETRITMGLYPEYGSRDGGSQDERAPAELGFAFNGHGLLDRADVSDALAALLEASGNVYEHRRGHRPDGRGRWWIQPGDGATDFARGTILSGEELNDVEAATAALWGQTRHVETRRWSWVEQFTYDDTGNRASVANGWGRIDYAYDEENRLMSSGDRTYTYDANGNMIQEALGDLEVAYAYNASNRVVDVNTEVEGLVGRHRWHGPSWTLQSGVRYEYDALGRRVSRTEYKTSSWGGSWRRDWNTETNTEYLYDGQSMRVLGEFRDTEYENDLAAPWTPWQWGGHRPRWGHHWGHRGRRSWWDRRPERYQPMSEYVYGNGDRVVSRNEFDPDYWHPRWESATYYHQDVLGSTSLMTNERGHTVERYTYDAFGVQTDGSFERVNEIGYTGQRYDPTTNMYNYGFRDYAPSIARFTTVDPIRDGNNWYAYVSNNPINMVDPTGLLEVESADLYNNTSISDRINGTYEDNYYDQETHSIRAKSDPVASPASDPFAEGIDNYNDAMSEWGDSVDWGETAAGAAITGIGVGGMVLSGAVVTVSGIFSGIDDTVSPAIGAIAANAFVESAAFTGFGLAKMGSGLFGQKGPSFSDLPTTVTHSAVEVTITKDNCGKKEGN